MKQLPAPNCRACLAPAPWSFSLLVLTLLAADAMRSRAAAPHSDPLGHREDVEHGPATGKALAAADSGDDATTPHLRLLSQLGGSATSVALRGDMAYVGEGPRILVVDLAGPSGGGVQRLGISAPLPGVVRGLAWSGDLLAAIYRDALANLGNDGLVPHLYEAWG